MSMQIRTAERTERALKIVWEDGKEQLLPFIWLRDNDPLELHPQTKERIFDLTTVDIDIQPMEFSSTSEQLVVRWPNKTDDSIYSSEWLSNYNLERTATDPAMLPRSTWRADDMDNMPRVSATSCYQSNGLYQALTLLKQKGIVIIDGLEDDQHAGERFGDLIGFKRESNFGVMFDVESKPDPNNLAYTPIELPLHTDLPNQEFVPGFQFLHCYKNSANGGSSRFADGMAIAEDFKTECPDHYEMLVETPVPWRFHDDSCDIRFRRPVIGVDEYGKFTNLTFNAHLADVIDIPLDKIYPFYAAYQELMKRIRGDRYLINYTLQCGEMVIFDNLRVMHGRESFDPTSGHRHLRGYYIEHNEVNSRLRMLSK